MISRPTNGTTDFIVVRRADTDHAIGIVGIKETDSQEIGFIFVRRYWGTGLAQEAVSSILSYLFGEKNMEEVIAEVEPGNDRCLKFLERQHFVRSGFKERVWEVDGIWWDSIQLTLKRHVWAERQSRQDISTR